MPQPPIIFFLNYIKKTYNTITHKMTEKDLNTVEATQNTENQETIPTDYTANADDKLQKEVAEWKDKYLRIYAEFDTFRRRTARETLELNKTAGKDIVKALLPILDDFERAFKHNPNETETKGFELIFNKLKNILEQRGLKQMESINTVFDPDFQLAIAEIPAPTPELSGKVIDEVERGYYLHDTIIRHARVVVGK